MIKRLFLSVTCNLKITLKKIVRQTLLYCVQTESKANISCITRQFDQGIIYVYLHADQSSHKLVSTGKDVWSQFSHCLKSTLARISTLLFPLMKLSNVTLRLQSAIDITVHKQLTVGMSAPHVRVTCCFRWVDKRSWLLMHFFNHQKFKGKQSSSLWLNGSK